MFGKPVSELQTDVVVGVSEISGTLNYVTDYTDFSSEVDEQSGNYLVLKVDNGGNDDVRATVEVVGGEKGPVKLDSDMNIVLLIKSNTDQSVRVVLTLNGAAIAKTYTLTGLTLSPAA